MYHSVYKSLKGQMFLYRILIQITNIPLNKVEHIVPDIPNSNCNKHTNKFSKARYFYNANKYEKALDL